MRGGLSLLIVGALAFWPGSAPGRAADPNRQPPAHRLPDDRPPLDPVGLRKHGLAILESRHLRLVTDLPVESVQLLPPLADALFVELENQLGALSPAVDGAAFQVTGFLMDAPERFEQAGLLPPEEFEIRHGRHLGYRFWMRNQTAGYYRRHLLLHEFTHCFLMCEFGMQDIPPLWYTEGIAEFFATHELTEPVSASRFGVLPSSVEPFEGWGRIGVLQAGFELKPSREIEASGMESLDAVRFPSSSRFVDDQNYARAWALVWLIRNHPELRNAFGGLARMRTDEQFRREAQAVPEEMWQRLRIVWPLVLDSLTEGFDVNRSFPALGQSPEVPAAGTSGTVTIAADRGWQPAGITISTGLRLELECRGRYWLHDDPRPWFSEPQGITLDYHRGRPLGEVAAMLVWADGSRASRRIPVGRAWSEVVPGDAELWLQINDSAASRAGNGGTVEIFWRLSGNP